MCVWETGVYYTRVINFSKNYRNVITVPAAVAMLLERRNGQKQSSYKRQFNGDTVTMSSSPAVTLTAHTLTILGIHIAHLGLH